MGNFIKCISIMKIKVKTLMPNIGLKSIHEYMYMYFGEVGKFKLPSSNVVDNLHQQIGPYCLCMYMYLIRGPKATSLT